MNSTNSVDINPQEQSVFFYGDDAPSYNIEFINHLKHISESKKILEDSYSTKLLDGISTILVNMALFRNNSPFV